MVSCCCLSPWNNTIGLIDFWFLVFQRHFQQYFSYIMATSFSGGGSRSTRREPPTMGKQLVNLITCGCESSAPFFVIYKTGREPRRIGDRLVRVVRSSDLTHWATRGPNTIRRQYSEDKYFRSLPSIFIFFSQKICLASSNERMMNAIVFSSHRFAFFYCYCRTMKII